MNQVELTDCVELTDAEEQALRIVANSGGRASWYQVQRLVTPAEYPERDTDSVRILERLEQAGLIARTAESGRIRPFTATAKGMKRLSVGTNAKVSQQ